MILWTGITTELPTVEAEVPFLNVFPVNRPEVMIGNAPQRFDSEGNLTDETTKDYIRQLLRNLVELMRRHPAVSGATHFAPDAMARPNL